MIVNQAETHAVSSLSWIDANRIWAYEIGSDSPDAIDAGDARFLSLHAGRNDLFAAVHHYGDARLFISARRIDNPSQVLARIDIDGDKAAYSGETSAWADLPRAYVSKFTVGDSTDYTLFWCDHASQGVDIQRFHWYGSTYDHEKQGIAGVTEIPGQELLLVSIQHDSTPVVYDPNEKRLVRRIELAEQNGNAFARFRSNAAELWVTDYDHLVRLNVADWTLSDEVLLQTAPDIHALFIGETAFNADESLCAVARPFSNDVIGVDSGSFAVSHRAETGGEPFAVALLRENRVIARDMKTGELLRGTLERVKP